MNTELIKNVNQRISKLSREDRRRLYQRAAEVRKHPEKALLTCESAREESRNPIIKLTMLARRGETRPSTQEIARRLMLEEGIGENNSN